MFYFQNKGFSWIKKIINSVIILPLNDFIETVLQTCKLSHLTGKGRSNENCSKLDDTLQTSYKIES